MTKVLVLVEGQTEERFVKDILIPALAGREVHVIPTIISTKVVKSGADYKGGVTSYAQVKKEVQNLLKDTNASVVTTMIDFYGLPADFPTWNTQAECYSNVEAAEEAFRLDIGDRRFIPYFQLHEFEGLLFSAPAEIASALGLSQAQTRTLESVRASFQSPEEINHGPATHPARRLLDLNPAYSKVPYGTLIAGRAGLVQIRENCPHFNQWLERLSSL